MSFPTRREAASSQAMQVPSYALKHAPLVYLHKDELFFPSHPVEHLANVHPKTYNGDGVNVPVDIKAGVKMLALPDVNKGDIFLTLNADVRKGWNIPELQTTQCKPDAQTSRSHSPCFIIVANKPEVAPGIVDVFYFFFYAFNAGNKVLVQHFGNHVGDWEHCMIRFLNGVPTYVHLSAHSDGNAWEWKLLEKDGDRPVIYCSIGSHALYPRVGTHEYSGVIIVGPQDNTSKGSKWDPILNFCAASVRGGRFTALESSHPGLNKEVPADDVVAILSFEGRWGNSFSELRKAQPSWFQAIIDFFKKLMGRAATDAAADAQLSQAEQAVLNGEGHAVAKQADQHGIGSLTLYQRLLLLVYSEGPTGPRDKSLDRRGMNRWENRMPLTVLN